MRRLICWLRGGHAWEEQPWPALEPGVPYDQTERGLFTMLGFTRYERCARCDATRWCRR